MVWEEGVDQEDQSTFGKLKSPTMSKFEEYSLVTSLIKSNKLNQEMLPVTQVT